MRGDPEPLCFAEPVTLVGAGPLSKDIVALAVRVGRKLIAVDGGANRLREWGFSPLAIIGDFDSVESPETWEGAGVRMLRIGEQHSTDLHKCLRSVRAPVRIGVGFLGGRLDHTLAAFGLLVSAEGRGLIHLGTSDLAFAPPLRWQARLAPGTRLSIQAIREIEICASSGLSWPPDGLRLGPESTRGISNVATGHHVEITFAEPGAVLVVARSFLPEVVNSLAAGEE